MHRVMPIPHAILTGLSSFLLVFNIANNTPMKIMPYAESKIICMWPPFEIIFSYTNSTVCP